MAKPVQNCAKPLTYLPEERDKKNQEPANQVKNEHPKGKELQNLYRLAIELLEKMAKRRTYP